MKSKWCLVTGAGTRVGAAIAMHMLERGFDLIAHYNRSRSGVDELVDLSKGLGRTVLPVGGDFSTRNGIEAFREDLLRIVRGQTVDVIIHSAAVMRPGRIELVGSDAIEMIMNINTWAPLGITQSLSPLMADGGSVIMISDIASEQTWREYPIYGMSKKQLELIGRHFAKALAPKVRVNTIQLGLVLRSENESIERWATRIDRTPLKRAVTLEELTTAIDHLITDRSMTGTTLVLDNGASLK